MGLDCSVRKSGGSVRYAKTACAEETHLLAASRLSRSDWLDWWAMRRSVLQRHGRLMMALTLFDRIARAVRKASVIGSFKGVFGSK